MAITLEKSRVVVIDVEPQKPKLNIWRSLFRTSAREAAYDYLSIDDIAQGDATTHFPSEGDSHYLSIFKPRSSSPDLRAKLQALPEHTYKPVSWLIEHLSQPVPELYIVDRELHLLSTPDILHPFFAYALSEGTAIHVACGPEISSKAHDAVSRIFALPSNNLELLYYSDQAPPDSLPPYRFMFADFDIYREIPSSVNRWSIPVDVDAAKDDMVRSDSMVREYRDLVSERKEGRLFLNGENFQGHMDALLTYRR